MEDESCAMLSNSEIFNTNTPALPFTYICQTRCIFQERGTNP